jgi:Leucine-rich repeat (LRR) protein
MEDNDENIQPDSLGALELKYRGWTELPTLASFAYCLLSLGEPRPGCFFLSCSSFPISHPIATLDVSFNQLQSLPDEITSLCFLQTLGKIDPTSSLLSMLPSNSYLIFISTEDVSCNKLQALPKSIGSLENLTVLKANGNQIAALPSSIGDLQNLQQLILSENNLTALPQELEGCTSLQRLLLQNNDLSRLPLSLATLKGTLREIDLANNNHQLTTTIPAEVLRDLDSIMWILTLQREKRLCIDTLKQDTKHVQYEIVGYEMELLRFEEQIAMLEEKKRNVKSDLEEVKYFLMARTYKRDIQTWMDQKWEEVKQACSLRL